MRKGYDRFRLAFKDLGRGMYMDIFFNVDQSFPPAAGVQSDYGPLHAKYASTKRRWRLSEDSPTKDHIRAINNTIGLAQSYADLLVKFSQQGPFFVTDKVKAKMERSSQKLGEIYRTWQASGIPEETDERLWEKIGELLSYQVDYVQRLASQEGVVTDRTTDLTPMRCDDYSFWDDVSELEGLFRDRLPVDKLTNSNLVAIAVASSLRRSRESRILTRNIGVTDCVRAVYEATSDHSDGVLSGRARECLSRKLTAVSVHFIGDDGLLQKGVSTFDIGQRERDKDAPRILPSKGNGDQNKIAQTKQPRSYRPYGGLPWIV